MLKLIIISLAIFSTNLKAEERDFVISSILSDENILVQATSRGIDFNDNSIFAIYSHETNQVLGIAKVLSRDPNNKDFIGRIEFHEKNGLVRIGNYLKKLDLTHDKNPLLGRYDLEVKNGDKVSSKYHPLVYLGFGNGFTASNLFKSEWLLGPSILAYGINSHVQVHTQLVSAMFKVLNFGLKYRIIENDLLALSIQNDIQFFYEKNKKSYLFTFYLDTQSNSKFKTLGKLKVFSKKPADEYLFNSDEYKKDVNIELQLSYSYILDNWNQLLVGPKVDVDKKKVGGMVGYYIIEKEIHTILGLSSNDFSEMRLGKTAYLVNFDVWWRF